MDTFGPARTTVFTVCAVSCFFASCLYWSAVPHSFLSVATTPQVSARQQLGGGLMSVPRISSRNTNIPQDRTVGNIAGTSVPTSSMETPTVSLSAQSSNSLLAGMGAAMAGAFLFYMAKFLRKQNASSDRKALLAPVDIPLHQPWAMATVAVDAAAPMDEIFENYKTGYMSVPADTHAEGWLECVQGQVPLDLTGTLLRNGPALFQRNGQEREYLDGDGLISQVAIKDGKVYFRSKFVETDSFKREQEAGRFMDLSIFTVSDPRPDLLGGPMWLYRLRDDIFNGPPNPKSNAAYNVLHWAGKTMAIDWGRPWALDSNTLEVVGDGKRDELSKVKYTAHFRILEQEDGRSVIVFFNPAVDWAKQTTTVTFYEFDDQGNKLQTKVVQFPATYFHDLIVTENYYVLFDCPIKMDYRKAFIGYPFGQNSLGDTVAEDLDKKPIFRIYPRKGDGEITVEAPELCYAFHHVNGFDEGNKLVFDTCTWDRFSLYFTDIVKPNGKEFYPKTKMSRFVIDLDSKTCTRSIIHEVPCEYPVVSPSATGKPYRHGFMCTSAVKSETGVNGPLQAITKVSFDEAAADCKTATLESWVPGKFKFSMEPVFAPRPNPKSEDDGWLLSLIHDGTPDHQGTEFVILDAQNIAAGPVATLRLPHYVPIGVHGSYTPDYLGPATA